MSLFLRQFCLMTLALGASACSTLDLMIHQEEMADYAESVFRHQNAVISTLMMLTEEERLPQDGGHLAQAEQAMHDACQLLNDYAARESDGESLSVSFRHQVQGSIRRCDNSIRSVEALLPADAD